MAKGDMGNPRVKVTSPAARPPKSTAKIAGHDHCAVETPGALEDLSAQVEIRQSPGWASRPR